MQYIYVYSCREMIPEFERLIPRLRTVEQNSMLTEPLKVVINSRPIAGQPNYKAGGCAPL